METLTGFASAVVALLAVFLFYLCGAALVLRIMGEVLPSQQEVGSEPGASVSAS